MASSSSSSPGKQSISSWPVTPRQQTNNVKSSSSSSSTAMTSRNGSRINSTVQNSSSKAVAKTVGKKSTAAPASSIYYGPSLPEPKPEEIAMQKIKRFEEEFANKIMGQIQRESPMDWRDSAMPRALHTGPFKWKRTEPILPLWKAQLAKETETKKKPGSLSLVAGTYGDTDDEDTEEEEEEEEGVKPEVVAAKAGSKRKLPVHMRVGSSHQSKLPKTQLKPVASIFREKDEEEDDDKEQADVEKGKNQTKMKTPAAAVVSLDKHGRKIYDSSSGTAFKKTIDDVAAVLCDKLEFLEVASITVSPLKVLAIKVEVGERHSHQSSLPTVMTCDPCVSDPFRRLAEWSPHPRLHAEGADRSHWADGPDRERRSRPARLEGTLGKVRVLCLYTLLTAAAAEKRNKSLLRTTTATSDAARRRHHYCFRDDCFFVR